MDNRLENIGDKLVIEVNAEIRGLVHITDFIEDIDGLTTARTVSREFRIQIEGMFWTDWAEMNQHNLAADNYVSTNVLCIQVRYTRTGTDDSGVIEFNSISFSGDVENIEYQMPTVYNSVFADIVNSVEFDALGLNIFKKLYYRGIVPQYIRRAENRDYHEDKDYIDLFNVIAKFFALLIRFYISFEEFSDNYDMLLEQTRGYGININTANTSIEDLRYLCENLIAQISSRGTRRIFSRRGDTLADGSVCAVDGEFIRLTQNKFGDELLFERIPKHRAGWCLGNCSPLYRGTVPSEELNKSKIVGEWFDESDLDKFNVVDTQNSEVTIENGRYLSLHIKGSSDYEMCGIGRRSEDNSQLVDFNKAIVCDSQLDYEISFSFMYKNSSVGNDIIVGLDGFDVNGNKLNDAFIRLSDSLVSDEFLRVNTDNFLQEREYHVRCIVHAYTSQRSQLQQSDALNIGFGHSLKFNNPFVKFFIPRIFIEAAPSMGEDFLTMIKNYKVRPLVRGKNILPILGQELNDCFSIGFIQCSNLSHTYYRCNNRNKTQQDITEIIEKYLYPFNLTNLFTITRTFN